MGALPHRVRCDSACICAKPAPALRQGGLSCLIHLELTVRLVVLFVVEREASREFIDKSLVEFDRHAVPPAASTA